MSAEVNVIHRHQAVCLWCAWWSDEVESEDAALEDAYEHNIEYHAEDDA